MGIVRTKALAGSYVFWPNIDKDIENAIKKCDSCQKLQPNPEKSPLIPWTPTESAWKRVHIDYAGPVHGFYILIIVDSFLKWVEAFKTKDITSKFTICKLREVFCRLGLPHILVSDNGTQFKSAEFREFMQINGIEHKTTSPGHAATNGQAENSVKTIKKSIIATLENSKSQDFDAILSRILFDIRITKHCTTNESPSKILFGRELRSRFSLLKPPVTSDVIKSSQQTMIKNFKGKRDVSFQKGQKVYVRNYKNPNKASWSKAEIKKVNGPRNYTCLLLH